MVSSFTLCLSRLLLLLVLVALTGKLSRLSSRSIVHIGVVIITHIMSTIKLNHVPLLESAQNLLEWKRFIMQILQAEGYWTHVEGTDGAYDIFLKSLEPAACTAESKAEEKATFRE